MFPTARQGYVRTMAVKTFPQALPAESSRQALLRALTPQIPHSPATFSTTASQRKATRLAEISARGGYSTAAALKEEEPIQHVSHDRHWSTDNRLDSPFHRAIQESRNSAWTAETNTSADYGHAATDLETLRGLILSRPLVALHRLCQLPHSLVSQITFEDCSLLLQHLYRIALDPNCLKPLEPVPSFKLLSRIIHSLPNSPSHDPFLTSRMRGRVLRLFLHCAIALDATPVALQVWRERLSVQLAHPDIPIINADKFIDVLHNNRQFHHVVNIFASDKFPKRLLTPHIMAKRMQTLLHLHQPEVALRLFHRHASLSLVPSVDAEDHAIQAHLLLGDLDSARRLIAQLSKEGSGLRDFAKRQLAILRGYRQLGLDVELERRVLHDMERLALSERTSAELLNAMIRLRLDAGDWNGAEALLARMTGKISLESFKLALLVVSHTGDLRRMEEIWCHMRETLEGEVQDSTVAALIRGLNRVNKAEEGLKAVHDFVSSVDDPSNPWRLPASSSIGIITFNALLQGIKSAGLDKVSIIVGLMKKAAVAPDGNTLRIIIDTASFSLVNRPADIANLMGYLHSANRLRPSMEEIDLVLAAAVHSASLQHARSRQLATPSSLSSPSAAESRSPNAGLHLEGPFGVALRPFIQSLTARGRLSNSRSLLNRLRYNSQTRDFPSARKAWNSLISRGFRPTSKHFLALLQGYCENGLLTEAEELLKVAEEVGTTVDKRMLTVMVTAYGISQNAHKAQRTHELIAEKGWGDAVSHTALIQALYTAGKFAAARRTARMAILRDDADDQLLYVVLTAMAKGKDIHVALRTLKEKKPEGQLSTPLRKFVRHCRNYLKKNRYIGKEEERRLESLGWTEEILVLDDKVRPRAGRRKPSSRSAKRKLKKLFTPAKRRFVEGAARNAGRRRKKKVSGEEVVGRRTATETGAGMAQQAGEHAK
ncbi:hypothetical protein P7C73_g3875, partial [Tremellales sp. Uapishka_1]